jgi:hypothetical protein
MNFKYKNICSDKLSSFNLQTNYGKEENIKRNMKIILLMKVIEDMK